MDLVQSAYRLVTLLATFAPPAIVARVESLLQAATQSPLSWAVWARAESDAAEAKREAEALAEALAEAVETCSPYGPEWARKIRAAMRAAARDWRSIARDSAGI